MNDVPDNWRPIATAPKDGRKVLVWDGRQHRICIWDDGSKFISAPLKNKGYWREGGSAIRAVNWMPLPEPPTV